MPCFDLENVLDELVRGEDNGLGDESVFVALHSSDHRSLLLCSLVVVDNTNPSQELSRKTLAKTFEGGEGAAHRHRNGHLGLGHGIHRTTHERSFEGNIASDLALRVDGRCRKIDASWKEQEIVVGEATMDLRVHKIMHRQSILTTICLEMLESRLWIEISRSHGVGALPNVPIFFQDLYTSHVWSLQISTITNQKMPNRLRDWVAVGALVEAETVGWIQPSKTL